MRVGIVVPVLNESKCIDTLLSDINEYLAGVQGTVQVDLLAVDGGSSDDTVEKLRAHGVAVVSAPPGRASQLSAGIARLYASDVLLLLHADSRLYPGYFADLCTAVRAGSVWGFSRVRLDSQSLWARWISVMMNLRSRWTGICTGDQAMYMQPSALMAVGGIPQLALMEDVSLAARLLTIAPAYILPGTVQTSVRRWQKRGIIRTVWLMWLLRALHYFNVDDQRLHQWYK